MLGAEGISLQIRHITSYLLKYCVQNEGYDDLLHQVIEFIGFFAIHHQENQVNIKHALRVNYWVKKCPIFGNFNDYQRAAFGTQTIQMKCVNQNYQEKWFLNFRPFVLKKVLIAKNILLDNSVSRA